MQGTIEERIAYLEGKAEEHSRTPEDLKETITHLEGSTTWIRRRTDSRRNRLKEPTPPTQD